MCAVVYAVEKKEKKKGKRGAVSGQKNGLREPWLNCSPLQAKTWYNSGTSHILVYGVLSLFPSCVRACTWGWWEVGVTVGGDVK